MSANAVSNSQVLMTKGKGLPDFMPSAAGVMPDDYMVYDYDNEEAPTDEARTNEEGYEEVQQHVDYSKYPPELKGILN